MAESPRSAQVSAAAARSWTRRVSWLIALIGGIALAKAFDFWRNGRTLGVTSPASTQPSASPPIDSNVLTVDVAVVVYTHDRPRHLVNLLHDLEREANATTRSVHVHVIDDASLGCLFPPLGDNVYSASRSTLLPVSVSEPIYETCASEARFRFARRALRRNNWALYTTPERHGRRRYWHLIAQTHALLRRTVRAQFYLFLPDDDRLCRGFIDKALGAWDAIEDDAKVTLMLHTEASRADAAVWTPATPAPVNDLVERIGWVESGNFLASDEYLALLNYSFPPIPTQRWVDNPPISSGVGATLSTHFFSSNRGMYRTRMSLVAHVGVHHSHMNPSTRSANPLRTVRYADGDGAYAALVRAAEPVAASLASTWTRAQALHGVVDSLAPQVDTLAVYLNGYDAVPGFVRRAGAWVVVGGVGDAARDVGDAGKFFWAGGVEVGYHLTCDDDIVYPEDYVARMVGAVEGYGRKAAVGVHGIVLKERELRAGRGYYASRVVYHALEDVADAAPVHIVGTGTLAYHTDIFPRGKEMVLSRDFPQPNMADVWFALIAKRRNLPLVVIPHAAGWLREVPGTFDGSLYQLYTRRRSADIRLTRAVLDALPWPVLPIPTKEPLTAAPSH